MNDQKLENAVKYALSGSTFYGSKIDRNRDIPFDALPFTTKKEIIADQVAHPPFGSNLIVSIENVRRVHKTSGTTNTPVIIAMTGKDIETTVRVGAACFRSAGLKRADIVFHCLNYNMWAGGYTDHQSLEEAGATVVPFGVGNTEQLLQMIMYLKATAIHCTPSYLVKLEETLRTAFNANPMDLHLRLGLFGGESGLQNHEFRHHIEKTWGFQALNANYGLSEVLSMVASECHLKNSLHFMGVDVLYPELINPADLKTVPIKTGAEGELVLTNLMREAQPLIRYRTGDVIKIVGEECECGLSSEYFRFEVVGRSDDMLVYKGLNIFPSSIEQIINRFLQFYTNMYQIIVNRKDPIDRMIIRLELRKAFESRKKELEDTILEEISTKLGIRLEIETVEEGTIPRTEGKHKKIVRAL